MTYTYDACQRLKEECVTDANGNLLSRYTYGLGKAGERLTITEETDGITTEISYTYDSLNRLVKETIKRNQNELTNEYTYDKVSNRISKTTTVTGELSALADTDSDEVEIVEGTTTYTYNALNQLVTETTPEGTITYTYDGNGNLILKSGKENAVYTYDAENHLLSAEVKKEDSVTKVTSLTKETYTYDYAGNRTSKTVEEGENTDTTYYVTETSGSLSQVVAETNEAGEIIAFYTLGEDLISMERSGETWYYIYDGHGSVRYLTDSNGAITDSYSYDAYGNLLEKEGTTENDFLYAGEQYNAGTGLYYLRARYMDPSTGTFISMDSYQGSIYDPVSLHKYLYANANSVTYIDPSGYSADKTLLGMKVTNIISSIFTASIQMSFKALVGALTCGGLGAIDSALAGNDFEQIWYDAREWAFWGGILTNVAECKLFLKVGPVLGVVVGYFGIKDSVDNGHGWQALFRIGLSVPWVLASIRMIKSIKLPKFSNKGTTKSGTQELIEGTSIYGDKSYYSGGRRIIEGVDPNTLKVGNQQTLDPVRLNQQKNLIKNGIERNTLIQVTKDGVIYDGHHGVRAALEMGKYIDVEIVPQTIMPSNIPISKLPIRGSNRFVDFLRKIFE